MIGDRRVPPLAQALIMLGVIEPPIAQTRREREFAIAGLPVSDLMPHEPPSLSALADIGARIRADVPETKREKYEKRPIAERKERRRKRKQRRRS